MIRAAVLGSPIKHSLSPDLHKRAYELLGIEGDYLAIETDSQSLGKELDLGLEREFVGFNLTMPLKESVFKYELCSFDDLSTRIGSANTLIREDRSYLATSTDARAFARLLEPFNVERVAIIGGGGTARALVGALAGSVRSVDLLLRTPSRLEALERIAPTLRMTAIPMDSSLEGYDLVVNTSPAGAADHLARSIEKTSGIFFESLYKPWPTELTFAWKELGGATFNGLDLLVEQALDAIALMTKRDFDFDFMRTELLATAHKAIDAH